MKISAKLTIIALCILCLAGVADAKKGNRKLTVGAYLSSAKIEIVSGDMERYETAIAYLDSLFINYGPHAEGLHLMGQIMVDYIDKTPDLEKRKGYVEKLVAYVDSLHMCCENKDLKKGHRKDCDKYIELSDSVKVRYWREFYNNGIQQLTKLDELNAQLASASDSSMIAMLKRDIVSNRDSCIANMEMVITIDDDDHRPFVGLSSAYEKTGDLENAIEWLDKGLPKASDPNERGTVLQTLAYYNIQLGDFCGAIPHFKAMSEIYVGDTGTLYNLQACYNNCKFFDSALMVNRQILEYAPNNLDALTQIGRFFNDQARMATDSANVYRDKGEDAAVSEWMEKRDGFFDSSTVYFKAASDASPNDVMALEQYGTVVAIRGKYKEAEVAFAKLTQLQPDNAEYWRSLGDFRIRLKDWTGSIAAYEKTVEIDPNDVEVWEQLADLYHNEGMTKKEAAAKEKANSLK